MRREVEPFLKKLVVVLLLSEDDAEYVKKMVESHKGTVKDDVTRRTTVVVKGDGVDDADIQTQLNDAATHSIPVVSQDWLIKCFTDEDLLTDEIPNYEIKAPAAAVAAEEEEEPVKKRPAAAAIPAADLEEETAAAPPPAKKSKLAEIVDDEEEAAVAAPVKKVASTKLAAAPAAPAAAAAASMDVDEPATAPAAKKGASTVAKRAPCPMKANTSYMGVCSSDDSHIPFVLRISSIISGAVEGTVQWPTLKGAEMKMKGTIAGSSLQYTEYEIITGEEDVEIGTEYTATVAADGTSLTGTWELAPDSVGTFTASIIPSGGFGNGAAAAGAANGAANGGALAAPTVIGPTLFAESSKYSGVCITEHDFKLIVDKRNGNIVSGTIEWPSLKYISNFEGEIVGSQLKFSETSAASKQPGAEVPPFPTLFSGNLEFDASAIKGSRGDLGNASSFTIKLNE